MHAEQTTWGEIWPYGYVQDARGEVWKILDEKQGFILMANRAGQQVSQPRPADHVPVTGVFYTEQEAMDMLFRVFPGARIITQGGTT